jgi:PAS domain S-box-containing protein
MTSEDIQGEYNSLLGMLYAIPFGVLFTKADGNIELLNGSAVNLLMMLGAGVKQDNIYEALGGLLPELEQTVRNYPGPLGLIMDKVQLRPASAGGHGFVVSLQVRKMDENRLMFVMADISSEVLAKQKSLAHQKRLLDLVEAVQIGVWEFNLGNGLLTVSDLYLSALGYKPGDINLNTTTALEALIHPEDLPPMRQAWQAHLAGECHFYEVEYRMKHAQGHWVWMLSRARLVTVDETSDAMASQGIQFDISERKKLLLDLDKLRHDLGSVLSASSKASP